MASLHWRGDRILKLHTIAPGPGNNNSFPKTPQTCPISPWGCKAPKGPSITCTVRGYRFCSARISDFARHSHRGIISTTRSWKYSGRRRPSDWAHFGILAGTLRDPRKLISEAHAAASGPIFQGSDDGHSSCFPISVESKDTTSTVFGGVLPNLKSGQGAVRVLSRTLALSCAVACVAWLLCAGRGHAANDNRVLVTLGERASDWRGAIWPKSLQIWAVLKDQGLFLSALLGLSAFFSMAETSIMTLWPWKVRELAEKEGEGGVFRLLSQDVTRFLTTILIGTTVVNIAATALVTDAATSLFGEAGVTAATGVMTVVILLVTEIAPKSIAVHNATKVARFTVRPVAWLSVILYPVGRVVTALSVALLKFLGLKSTGETFVSEEELKLMLRGAELSGAIEEEEQDMIENVLEIKDTFVREVMTPLIDVVAIDAESTLMEFRDYWVKHQYSRTPVFERRVDNIIGIAYAMDMLDYIDYDAEQVKTLRRLTVGCIAHRPAYFVPDSMSVWNLLREFRIRKVHMAIVLNEYGGAVGVVTLEDVVEEIVGEIFDENDSKEEIRKKTGYVVQRADGVFDVDANTHIEDLADALEVKMPEGPYRYETVSGFVCEAFGYIPRTGESINIILKKADTEDTQERGDGEEDHQEDNKEKVQKYSLEILAGNARKVGAVRFQMGKAHSMEDGAVFPQSTGAFGNVLGRPVDSSKERSVSTLEGEDEFCEAEFMEAECEESVAPFFRNGSTVMDSKATESAVAEEDDEGNSTGPKVAWRQEWIEKENQVDRRIQRRKQSARAKVELDRERRIDMRRQEVELATVAMKQEINGTCQYETFEES